MNSLAIRFAASTSSRTGALAAVKRKACWSIRQVHRAKSLEHSLEDGFGEFLPPAALKVVAVDYQNGLLDRLNEEVRDTPCERETITQTIVETAGDRSRSLAFNYASNALNNSFFLDMLAPAPPSPATSYEGEISSALMSAIRTNHASLEQLKSNFSAAAMGLTSSGWIWFVADKEGATAILPTFGAGTLLIQSRAQIAGPILSKAFRTEIPSGSSPQRASPAKSTPPPSSRSASTSPTSPTSGLSVEQDQPNLQPHSRVFHTSLQSSNRAMSKLPNSIYDFSRSTNDDPTGIGEISSALGKVDMLQLGQNLIPLFCVSVHEHAWMSAGYGVWGKEEWLKKFWTVLNWEKVSKSYNAIAGDKYTM